MPDKSTVPVISSLTTQRVPLQNDDQITATVLPSRGVKARSVRIKPRTITLSLRNNSLWRMALSIF